MNAMRDGHSSGDADAARRRNRVQVHRKHRSAEHARRRVNVP